MKFQINNINFQADIGYLMTFDVYFQQVGIKLFRLRLVRPDAAPDQTWLHLMKAEDGGFAVFLGPKAKKEIGDEATRIYNKCNDTDWRFTLKPGEQASLDEREDAGLRRVLCAAERESLERAGI